MALHTDWKPGLQPGFRAGSGGGPRLDRLGREETYTGMTAARESSTTLDADEVRRFERLAKDWWDMKGPFKPLHRINPVRLTYIRDQLCKRFGRDPNQAGSLKGLKILDIGCGGGLVCEPLTRLGAEMTGIDPAEESIKAARIHAEGAGLAIGYEAITAEAMAARGETFDAVLLLEVVEHVPDVPAFLRGIAPLVRSGGVLILSTLNRTLKAYALAIVGAELILRWIPAGTHQWERFVTPAELNAAIRSAGLAPSDVRGMVYNPLTDVWRLSSDTDVNYFATALRA